MAHFLGEVTGTSSVTRTGTKASGISANVRGWNVGVAVDIRHVNGVDVVTVYRTTGSSHHGRRVLVAEFSEVSE